MPADLQTTFKPLAEVDEPGRATLVIDSSGDRVFFPIPEERRSFRDKASLASFVAETFGGRSPGESPLAVRGSYVWRGTAYFVDPELVSPLRVVDPVLAYLGGLDGIVELEGQEVCLDPDGDCRQEPASYLEPVGQPTAPTHVNHCGRPYAGIDVCVQHHAFFNKAWFWARHGANVRLTYFAALPTTRMTAAGAFHYRTGLGFPEFDAWPLPRAETRAENSVETAVWCLFGPCIELDAEAVCGETYVSDPDVVGSRLTGNGPLNNSRCPG